MNNCGEFLFVKNNKECYNIEYFPMFAAIICIWIIIILNAGKLWIYETIIKGDINDFT